MTTLLEDLKAAHAYAVAFGGLCRSNSEIMSLPLTVSFRTPERNSRGVAMVYLVTSTSSFDANQESLPECDRTCTLLPTMMIYEMNNVGLHEHYDILTAITRARDMLARLLNLFGAGRWTVAELEEALAALAREKGEG